MAGELDTTRLDEIYGENAYNPDAIFRNGRAGRSLRVIGGHIVKNLAEAPALPTVLYGLADTGLQMLKGNTEDAPVLPGIAGAREFTHSVDENAMNIGASVAGETLKPGLLSNDDRAHQAGTVFGLVASPLPIAGPALKVVKGIKEFDTGVKALNTIKNTMVNSSAIVSPIIPTKHVGAFMGANAAIGGGITVAAEMMASPDPAVVAQGDNIAEASVSPAAVDTFKQGTAQATLTLEQALRTASDTTLAGYQDATGGNKELEDALKMNVGEEPTGFSDEDYKKAATIAGGTLLTGLVAWKVGTAKARTVLRAFGGDDFSKANMSGAQGAITKLDESVLSAGDIAKAQAVDAGAPLKKLSSDPEMMAYKIEDVAAAPQYRRESIMIDGSLGADTTVRLRTSGSEIEGRIREIAKDAQALQLLRDGLISTSEQSHRVNAWLDKLGGPAGKKIAVDDPVAVRGYEQWLSAAKDEKRFSFHKNDTNFADLRATVQAARANPLINSVMDDLKDVSHKMLDFMVEKGAINATDRARLLREHPHFVALPIEGSHMSRLELSRAGGRNIPGDPISEIFPYMAQVFKETAHENMKTSFLLEQISKKASFLGKSVNPNTLNQHTRETAVIYRDAAGNRRAIEVAEPTIRAALRGDAGSGAMRMSEGLVWLAERPSRALEWATTGPAAAAVGSPFPLANLAYGTVAILNNRPVGTAAGFADKLVQNTIGSGILKVGKWDGKFGLRADPTYLGQVAYQAGENVVAVLAKHAAKVIENITVNHSVHGPSASPSSLAALGKTMSEFYKSRIIHDMEMRALKGGATPMYQGKVQSLADIEANMTRSARLSAGWPATRDFIHDIFGAVGNAPLGAFYRQNKGRMSDELLTTRTRNVLGDPSKSGLAKSEFGKVAQGLVNLTPWGGVTVQSTARFLKAWKENPAGTAMAIMGTVGLPTYLSTLYNMSLGAEHLDYMYNKRTADQAAGSLYFGIPGLTPQEGIEIRLDQPMRPFKVMFDTLLGHQFGMFDGSIFSSENAEVREALLAGLKERYGPNGHAMKAAMNAVLPAPYPGIEAVNILRGVDSVGRDYTSAPTKIVENRMRGASDSTSSHIDNKLFGYNVSAEMEAMVSALGGQFARGVYEMLTGIEQSKKDDLTFNDATSDFKDRFRQRISQANREIAPIWGHANVMSPSQEASAQALKPRIQGIKLLEAASEKLRSLHGSGDVMTGGRKREIEALIGEGPVAFKDEQMQSLARGAQVFMRQYNTRVAGPLKSLYEQRASVQSSTRLRPDTKSETLNNITGRIVDINRQGLGMVRQWEYGQSKMFGRDISIDKIKLGEGIDQFPQSQ